MINSRDASEDADLCGDGTDTALVDELDFFHISCESVHLPGEEPRPVSPIATGPQVSAAPRVTLRLAARQRLATVLAKGLVIQVTCSEMCALDGQLLLDARTAKKLGLTKGRKPIAVARGRAAKAGRLAVRFGVKARKRLRRVKRLTLTLVVRATDPAGNTATSRRRVILTRKRVTISGQVGFSRALADALRGGAVKLSPARKARRRLPAR